MIAQSKLKKIVAPERSQAEKFAERMGWLPSEWSLVVSWQDLLGLSDRSLVVLCDGWKTTGDKKWIYPIAEFLDRNFHRLNIKEELDFITMTNPPKHANCKSDYEIVISKPKTGGKTDAMLVHAKDLSVTTFTSAEFSAPPSAATTDDGEWFDESTEFVQADAREFKIAKLAHDHGITVDLARIAFELHEITDIEADDISCRAQALQISHYHPDARRSILDQLRKDPMMTRALIPNINLAALTKGTSAAFKQPKSFKMNWAPSTPNRDERKNDRRADCSAKIEPAATSARRPITFEDE